MSSFTTKNLKEGDVVLYVDCPILTRIVKKITKRSVMFHDNTSASLRFVNMRLAANKFEVTRNGELIHPE